MAGRFQRATARQIICLVVAFHAVFLGSISLGRCLSAHIAAASRNAQAAELPPTGEPTGAARCVFCHATEVEGYARSAMAHSLRRAAQEPGGTVTAGDTKITMHSSAGGYWQRWENGEDKSDYRVDYVVGSGSHASGYLIDLAGHLFQSPVAYYKSRQSYDLAPGYENLPDPDFTRPVSEECLLCHSGTALHIPGTLNQYRPPIFAATGITCERCHGPVEKHLADPRAGTIINPANLEPGARDSVCEQCHLFGSTRVPNPGKKLSDFVPGHRLEETYTIYHNATPAGSPAGDFKVISHVEQLAQSACARNSDSRLWCGTCHNPHEALADSVAYYRARCLTCHTASFSPSHPARDSDCLGCHMPRRDAKDGGHAAFTDHRIQRRPEPQRDLPANSEIEAWREPPPELRQRNLGIAFIDVGMQRHSSPFVIRGYRALTEVQRQFRNDADFFKWIGEALLIGKQTADAKFAFERALALDPNSALTEASAASPYIQEGDVVRAIAHLERAVSRDPLNLPAASTLIGLYQKEGKTTEAAALSGKIKAAMSEGSGSENEARKDSTIDSPNKAGEVYKNIQILKQIRSSELIPAMQFMSSSLGVECSFCHVEGHFDKDDKKTKKTARDMMKMMFALNQSEFNGQRELTCYSCHRGANHPAATPVVGNEPPSSPGAADSEPQKLATSVPPAVPLPSAVQLIDNYIRALGGAPAINNITSRVEKGAATSRGQSAPVEAFTQSPARRALIRHLPAGDSTEVFDGRAGWVGLPGRPARDLHGADMEAARVEADLQFALHIEQMFPELRVEYPEKIEGREVNVLYGIREGQPAVKFYFDQQSDLLVRLLLYTDSPLGVEPVQFDYADYRVVDGVKVPFHVVVSQPETRSSLSIEEIRQNVPIDASKFAKPLQNHSPNDSTAPN
jgi:photosynthetic reaction center cytochrome c subunit